MLHRIWMLSSLGNQSFLNSPFAHLLSVKIKVLRYNSISVKSIIQTSSQKKHDCVKSHIELHFTNTSLKPFKSLNYNRPNHYRTYVKPTYKGGFN